MFMGGWWPSKVSVKALVTALSYRLTFLIDPQNHFKLIKFVIVTHRKVVVVMRSAREPTVCVFADRNLLVKPCRR